MNNHLILITGKSEFTTLVMDTTSSLMLVFATYNKKRLTFSSDKLVKGRKLIQDETHRKTK